jgi:hypothetical protein
MHDPLCPGRFSPQRAYQRIPTGPGDAKPYQWVPMAGRFNRWSTNGAHGSEPSDSYRPLPASANRCQAALTVHRALLEHTAKITDILLNSQQRSSLLCAVVNKLDANRGWWPTSVLASCTDTSG